VSGSLDRALDRIEEQLDAAASAVERADAGSIWDAIRRQDWQAALRGWDLPRRIAWSIEQGERHHDAIEDTASAARYATQWRTILWGDAGQPDGLSGAALLTAIRDELRAILMPEKLDPQI
jgi:hypothetical protein